MNMHLETGIGTDIQGGKIKIINSLTGLIWKIATEHRWTWTTNLSNIEDDWALFQLWAYGFIKEHYFDNQKIQLLAIQQLYYQG